MSREKQSITQAVLGLRGRFKEALVAKGVADPGDNMADYPEKIMSISAGAGEDVPCMHRVDWMDYNGRILKTEYVADGQAATPPDISGFRLQVEFTHGGRTRRTTMFGAGTWHVREEDYQAVHCPMEIMRIPTFNYTCAEVVAKAGETVALPFVCVTDGELIVWSDGVATTGTANQRPERTFEEDFDGFAGYYDNQNDQLSAIALDNEQVVSIFLYRNVFVGMAAENAKLADWGLPTAVVETPTFVAPATRRPFSVVIQAGVNKCVTFPSSCSAVNILGERIVGITNLNQEKRKFERLAAPFCALAAKSSTALLYPSAESGFRYFYSLVPDYISSGAPFAEIVHTPEAVRLALQRSFGGSQFGRQTHYICAPKAEKIDAAVAPAVEEIYAPLCAEFATSGFSFYSSASSAAQQSMNCSRRLRRLRLAPGGKITSQYATLSPVLTVDALAEIFENLQNGTLALLIYTPTYNAMPDEVKATATGKGYTLTASQLA